MIRSDAAPHSFLALMKQPAAVAAPELTLVSSRRERLRMLYEAHHDVVWRVLRRCGLDAARADDGAHDVFMVALARLDDIVEEKARAFLCGTAVRVARKLATGAVREELVETLPEIDHGGRPDEQTERNRRLALLDRLLAQLSEDLRVALVLHDLEGYSQKEIAQMLEIPEGTAASRLRRARVAFDELLEKVPGERS